MGGGGARTVCSTLGLPCSTAPTLTTTWTPKVCRIMALKVIIMCLGLLFHILLGFRQSPPPPPPPPPGLVRQHVSPSHGSCSVLGLGPRLGVRDLHP